MLLFKWGLLTSLVRSQKCNSCYANVAAELIENFYFNSIQSLAFTPLSVTQIMDCTGFGCNGGNMEDTMKYISTHPITYQYAYTNKCNTGGLTATYESYRDIEKEKLIKLLETGPLGVSIDKNDPCKNGDHMVLLVDYTNDEWVMKNSYGKDWGENGFFKTKCTPSSYVVKVTDVKTNY